jgi:beta-galactosidase
MFFRHVVLALAMLVAAVTPAAAKEAPPPPSSPRVVTDISIGWRFRFGGDAAGVMAAGYDDGGWEQVAVPHTWNRVGEYGLARSAATNNKQGIGWYRLTYSAPAAAKGRRQYLDFGAVGIVADVWVNGTHVGQHKGAYSRFRFDVTPAWKPGAANLIVVKADNSKPEVGSTTAEVLPLAGDFFIHGGMYRGVSLIEANDVGIDLLDFGGPGVYASLEVVEIGTSNNGGPRYVVVDKTRLRNLSSRERSIDFYSVVKDSNGAVVGEGERLGFVLKPGGTNSLIGETGITGPMLWDGLKSQNMYSITVEIREGKALLDSVTQLFGIRDFNFDPNTGFTLNGKPLKLKGVSRHQDRLGKGYALTRADHAEDMAIIKEMGANSVRQAHYQHADEWTDEADKAGMIVWAEVPYVTTPSLSGGQGSAAVFANAEQQMRELIRQNYNHPSIVMWSIGNEVDASSLFGLGGGATKPLTLLQHLQKVAKEEDPSRPTIFADCCEDVRIPIAGLKVQEADPDTALAGTADMIGYNRYYGWYYPEPLKAREQLAAQMDKFHAKHPTLPISISEYGAGGAIGQHSDNPMSGFVNAIGRPQPEEYESWVHEQSWPVIRDRPYIFGSYVWNMFDFSSDLRNEGDSVDINTKGLVTFDRKVKKDAFYYYQANWTSTPMIHLTGKRYVDRAYAAVDVTAYTNAKSAILKVGVGIVGEVPCPDHICVWKNVALMPSVPNTITVTAQVGDQVLRDTAIWNGPDPAKDGIHLDAGDISGRLLGKRRFGSDNFVTGGTPAVLNQGGLGGRRSGPLKVVPAADPVLYDYWREGEAFSYAIPVPDGKWKVTIHSFEPRTTGTPLMAVAVGGKIVVPAFNVQAAAGGSLKGLAKSFPVVVKGGVLKLDFSATGGKAVVAAIEIGK